MGMPLRNRLETAVARNVRIVALGCSLSSVAEAQGAATVEQPVRSFPPAAADEGVADPKAVAASRPDANGSVPIVAYAYSARGAPKKTFGAYGYGLGLAASGQDSVLGGGVTAWGSPIDRLTLIADLPRDISGRFTPSLAATGRFLGDPLRGWTFGGLAKWKAEGFGVGPHGDEIESEFEGGLLLSLNEAAVHFDANALAGFGTGPAGEADTEARLRFGYDLGKLVRLGVDSQARIRIAGPQYLPNGRTWDFAAGSQVMVGNAHIFGAFTAGPTTMGVTSESIGGTAVLTFGGTT
jgi:hypothetical protein